MGGGEDEVVDFICQQLNPLRLSTLTTGARGRADQVHRGRGQDTSRIFSERGRGRGVWYRGNGHIWSPWRLQEDRVGLATVLYAVWFTNMSQLMGLWG